MPTSVVPDVIDALVTAAKANKPSTTTVYDGVGVSNDIGDYLMVGVDDPDTDSWSDSADAQQDPSSLGPPSGARDQIGSVTCAALSWNGDGDQKGARDAARSTMSLLEAYVRTNPGLGIASQSLTFWAWFTPSETWRQRQGPSGAQALVIFRIGFFARL